MGHSSGSNLNQIMIPRLVYLLSKESLLFFRTNPKQEEWSQLKKVPVG